MSKHMLRIKFMGTIGKNYSQENATEQLWWRVNIGSGNGLVPSGNKPLPEPMLTQIHVACDHMASLGHIELIGAV